MFFNHKLILILLISITILSPKDIHDYLNKKEFKVSYNSKSLKYTFDNQYITLTFQENNTVYTIDNFTFNLRYPFIYNNKINISDFDYYFISSYIEKQNYNKKITDQKNDFKTNIITNLQPSIPVNYSKQKNKIDYIFIDPGHGGKDPGAIGYGFNEKDITLQISRLILTNIKKKYPKKKVYLTRADDKFVSLENRCHFANGKLEKNENSIFVSVHINASLSATAQGFEVYYLSYNPISENARIIALTSRENMSFDLDNNNIEQLNSLEKILSRLEVVQYQKESRIIAEMIEQRIINDGIKLNIKNPATSALFYILQGAIMPSILLEIGFISNKDDVSYVANPENQLKIADSITKGVNDYIKKFEESNGFTE